MEKIRQTGTTDSKPTIRDWHTKVAPTSGRDISHEARMYKTLMGEATIHSMALEGSTSEDTAELHQQAEDALRAIRHDIVVIGFSLWAFDMVVADNVSLIKRKEAEKEADWKLIRAEFPGQFPQPPVIDER